MSAINNALATMEEAAQAELSSQAENPTSCGDQMTDTPTTPPAPSPLPERIGLRQWTAEDLKSEKFRGPVAFYDGRAGMARQDFECVSEPRFGYFWRRENRKDRGRQAYMVDGAEVVDLAEAALRLNAPPAPDSPREKRHREHNEFLSSPELNYGATRAQSESSCNADAAPFGQIRAFQQRAGSSWHGGINRFSDIEREAGREFPSWLYDTKTAAYEAFRGIYLFRADRETDTDLTCALGVKCRKCPILATIGESMEKDRRRERWPSAAKDSDIDAAKVWTCIGHILSSPHGYLDGSFFTRKGDRP